MTKTDLLLRLAHFALEAQKTDATDFLRLLKQIEGDYKNGTRNSKGDRRNTYRIMEFRLRDEQGVGVLGRSAPSLGDGISDQVKTSAIPNHKN